MRFPTEVVDWNLLSFREYYKTIRNLCMQTNLVTRTKILVCNDEEGAQSVLLPSSHGRTDLDSSGSSCPICTTYVRSFVETHYPAIMLMPR